MSIKAMNWAFGLELKPVKKVIVLALADCADDDGLCWPGKKHLARKCSVAEKTVTRQMEELQAMGLVTVTQRKQGDWNQTNLYQLNLKAEVVKKEDSKPVEGRDNLTPPRDKETLQKEEKGRDNLTPPRDTAMTPPRDTGVPQTIKNHKTLTHTEAQASEQKSFDQRFADPVDAHPEYQPELNQPTGRRFAMYSSWQPDHTFTDQAKTLGLDLTTLDSEQGESIQIALEEFRTWWMDSRPGTQENPTTLAAEIHSDQPEARIRKTTKNREGILMETAIKKIQGNIQARQCPSPTPQQTSTSTLRGDEVNHSQRHAVNYFYGRVQAVYGSKFKTQFPSDEDVALSKREWAGQVMNLGKDDIDRGIEKLKALLVDRDQDYLWVNIPQLAALCQPQPEDFGMPDVDKAWHEAEQHCHHVDKYSWSHEAVRLAGKRTGWFEIMGSVSDKRRQSLKATF